MSNGWIKLHRKITDKAFYCKDSEKVHLWIHLLLRANHSEYEEMLGGKPIVCSSGQFTCGRKQLASETGISESKIERILNYFEKIEHQIEQQKTSTNRLISILNWCEYQHIEQQTEQQLNNERTTTEQQLNTLQEDKEIKNKYIYCLFYDSEIEKSNNDENFINFVKVLFGSNSLSKKLERVLKMQDQVSFEQFKLIAIYKEKYKISIGDYLVRMENWKDLTKKNTSVQQTLLNWIRKDKEK